MDDEESVYYDPHQRRDKNIAKHPVVLVKSGVCKNETHEKFKINERMVKRHIPPKDWYWCIHSYETIKKATKTKRRKWPQRGYKCISKVECDGQEFEDDERTARCRKCYKPIFGEQCLLHYWNLYLPDSEDEQDKNKNKNTNKNEKKNKNKNKNNNDDINDIESDGPLSDT